MKTMTIVEIGSGLLGYSFMPELAEPEEIERLANNLRHLLDPNPELSDVQLIHHAAQIFYIFFKTWPRQCTRCARWS